MYHQFKMCLVTVVIYDILACSQFDINPAAEYCGQSIEVFIGGINARDMPCID